MRSVAIFGDSFEDFHSTLLEHVFVGCLRGIATANIEVIPELALQILQRVDELEEPTFSVVGSIAREHEADVVDREVEVQNSDVVCTASIPSGYSLPRTDHTQDLGAQAHEFRHLGLRMRCVVVDVCCAVCVCGIGRKKEQEESTEVLSYRSESGSGSGHSSAQRILRNIHTLVFGVSEKED